MPLCRRDRDDAEAFFQPPPERVAEPDWREPPGPLGEYVRRVKRLEALRKASQA